MHIHSVCASVYICLPLIFMLPDNALKVMKLKSFYVMIQLIPDLQLRMHIPNGVKKK